jgi:hypothetical protein
MDQNRWPLLCLFRTWLKDNQARLQLFALVYNLGNFLWQRKRLVIDAWREGGSPADMASRLPSLYPIAVMPALFIV